MKFFFILLFLLLLPNTTSAATITWDGGGGTNNWSEAANWSSDILPGALDVVVFDATSVKDAVIDDSFSGTINTLNINSGYSGTVTQQRALTISATLSQVDGIFSGSTEGDTLSVTGAVTLSGGTFTAPVATTTFSSNFTHSSTSTFNHASGTVRFVGGGKTVDTSGIDFYNLSVELNANSFFFVTSNDRLYIHNNLSLLGGYAYDYYGGGEIHMLGQPGVTSTLNVGSLFQGNESLSRGISVMVTGTNPIAVNLTANSTSNYGEFPDLLVTNPNAVVTATGSGTLTGDGFLNISAGSFTVPDGINFLIRGVLTCSGGSMAVGSGTATYTGAATFSGCDYTSNASSEAYSSTFGQSGGTWEKSSGLASHAGKITLSGGSYTATPATTTITTNEFITSGGTFNHASGTVKFSGGGTAIDSGGVYFYNLSIELNANAYFIVSSNDRVYVYNDLSLLGGYSYDYYGGGEVHMLGQPGVTSTLTVGSSFQGNAALSQGTTYRITGTNPIAVDLSASASSGYGEFPDLLISNPNTTVLANGSGTLTGDGFLNISAGSFTVPDGINFLIRGVLTCSGGSMAVGSGTATYTGAATFSGCDYTSNASSETYSGGWTLSAGDFIATSATTVFNSNYTHTAGGTFNHSSGTVQFGGGSTATVDVASTENFYDLSIQRSSGITLTIATGDTIIAAGSLTLTDGIANTGSLSAYGNVTVASTWDGGTSPLVFASSDAQTFTLDSPGLFNGDISVNKGSASASVSLGSNLTLDASSQDLTIQEGILDLNGYTLVVNGSSGTFTVQDGGTLRMEGGETVTANAGYPQFQSGSTVAYTGSETYAMKDFTYYNLAIEGSGTFTLANNESIGNNVTVSGGTLDLGSYDLTIATGTYSNTGVLELNGDETLDFSIDPTVGTVKYTGTSTYASLPAGSSYNNVIFSGSGTWTQDADVTINGNVTISEGILNSNGYNITLAGDWSNSGTYTSGSNTTTFNGTNQSITGTTAFYNFVKTATTTDTLTFGAGQTQTVVGTLALNGGADSLLSLRSTVTGTAWILDPQNTVEVSYLDVKDSNNIGGTIIAYELNITDSGNNTGWTFTVASSGRGSTPPPAPPQAPLITADNPTGGFFVTLNDGATSTHDSLVTVRLFSGSDTAFVALANDELFSNSIQQTYHPSMLWKLSPGFGQKNVYVKFYTFSGGLSPVVSSTITILKLQSSDEEPIFSPEPAQPKLPVKPFIPPPNALYPPGFGPSSSGDSGTTSVRFTQTMAIGKVHEEVEYLQQLLNREGFFVARSGVGSQGRETNYFGGLTRSALLRFQRENNVPQTGIVETADRIILNRIWDQEPAQTPSYENLIVPAPSLPVLAPSPALTSFTRTLASGDQGKDVKQLQIWLNTNGFTVATQGPGSPGNETDYFGRATYNAVIKLQQKYADEILKPLGLRYPTGVFAGRTRAFVNERISL